MFQVKGQKKVVDRHTLIVAVDIGKKTNWAIFRGPDGLDSMPYQFTNSWIGFDKFFRQLIWHKLRHNTRRVVVGLESTGVYGDPLIHFLRSRHIRVVWVNPVHTKRVKEVRDNSPNKTDRKDPRVIADLIQLNCVLSVIVPDGDAAELRHLTHARERALALENALISQLHALVCRIFPEFFQVFKSLKGKTVQYLLKHHPGPRDVAYLNIDNLCRQIRAVSRGRISRSKLLEYQRLARETVGVQEGKQATLKEIRHLVEQLAIQRAYVKTLEKDISQVLHRIPVSRRLLSLKGIGETTAAIILGETANFGNMKVSREFEKLAGLNLFEISSGQHRGQKRISKRGRSLLRKALYFAALNVIKHDGIFQEKYQSYLKKGKPKNKALIAISRKLIRVIFALVRDNLDFDVNYGQNLICKKAA